MTRDQMMRKRKHQDVESQAMNHLNNVTLSMEQLKLKNKILNFCTDQLILHNNSKLDNISLKREYETNTKIKTGNNNDVSPNGLTSMFVIQGDAGTGKSVVLNSLFNEIQKLANTDHGKGNALHGTENYLVVNHPEMLKLYHRISYKFPYIKKASLERPTSLINSCNKHRRKIDIVVIDEGHLLATSKDAFKRFYGNNHLEELMSLAKILIIVYDDKQSLRMGSYWDDSDLKNGANLQSIYDKIHEKHKNWYHLKQQFRVVAPPDVLDWIDTISVCGKIPQFPQSMKQNQTEDDFDFKIWDDCGAMYDAIKKLNDRFGQCRILSTYDFPYRLDGKDYFVTCGDNFRLRWDRYQPKSVLPWSERPDSIDEVGSVYTIQGFDLNYAAVILGRSVAYDADNDCIKLLPELYDDNAGFTKKKNISQPDQVRHKIIMNSINVLLTRGVKGLYVYAYDDSLRKRLLDSYDR